LNFRLHALEWRVPEFSGMEIQAYSEIVRKGRYKKGAMLTSGGFKGERAVGAAPPPLYLPKNF